MQQALGEIVVETQGQGFYEVTERICDWVASQALGEGLLTVYMRHTSASLLIQENIDPDVQHDLLTYFRALVPEDTSHYRHIAEGADDQPAHIRAAMTQTHLAIPMRQSRPLLGRYQGIFVFEHRRVGRPRHLALHLLGV